MPDRLLNSPTSTVTKEDLEAILDGLVEGIVTLDDTGAIIGINRAACEILETEKPEALDTKCCDLLGRQLCQSASGIRESIRSGQPIRDIQIPVQTNSGNRKVLQFQTTTLPPREGRKRGSVVLFRDITELVALRENLERRYRLHNLVGKSKPMQEIFELITEVADSDATVLIEGESGTGKELVARAIHHLGPRSAGPYVAVNCSALAEGVLESELFGHVQGAFTGATRDKRGRFEAAAGGTIFLDEIGDVAPAIQVKLLRVLQQRIIERVGSEESVPVDIRVIAATNRPLAEMVAEGSFRRDFYYRLRVVPIHLPPLRERRDDLPLLAQHFVERFREETGRNVEGLDPEATSLLLDYPWPGNVRELENAIEYAFVKVRGGLISPEHLPPELRNPSPIASPSGTPDSNPAPIVQRAMPDKEQIHYELHQAGWNIARAARRLQISRTTLYKKISELGLDRPGE